MYLEHKKNYIMPTSFCKQVVFNCNTNSALANYFWKEWGFCETQDDIWSSAIKEIWFNWGILYMIGYKMCLWVRKYDSTNFGIKPNGYRVHHCASTESFLPYIEFKIISFRLQNYFYTTGTATFKKLFVFWESIMFFKRNIRTGKHSPQSYFYIHIGM